MANIGPRRYNEFFPIADGSARVVPATAKGIPGGPPQYGDVFVVYNPLLKTNYSVKYGFADAFASNANAVTAGRPGYEALGPPLGNQLDNDGTGTAYQQFHRGHMTWNPQQGVVVNLDFQVGDGWARKCPEHWNLLPEGPPGWGDYYWVFNPNLNKRLSVVRGFAQIYESTQYPETNGKRLCDVLGAPKDIERSDGADGAIQHFEGGTVTWNPREQFKVQLGAAAPAEARADAKKAMRPISMQEIAALSGKELSKTRTPKLRIAPSPTGYLHVGNAWIAVINYLMAKKLGGEFLLRIEDTDPLRSKPEYTEVIKDSLKWMGLEWDGEVVFQSQRSELYQQKVKQLIADGKAYKDSKTGAVFFKMPETGPLVVHDHVKGRVEVPLVDEQGMKDFPLLRADGSPMFLLANTVDDGEQGITHVIRGEGHLLNAARQVLLFRALGYEVPEFYHLPHIVGEDGSKLSKREGASSVLDFKQRGIDPEVVLNHLAGLGMKSSGDGAVRSKDQLIEGFDRLGFAKAPSRMGLDRLLETNKKRLSAMDSGELRRKLEAFDPQFMGELGRIGGHALADASRNRASTFEEAILIGKFVRAEPAYGEKSAALQISAEHKTLIGAVRAQLAELKTWNLGALRGALDTFNLDRGVKFRAYAGALQWMLTGDTEGIPIEHTMAILGKDETLERLDAVLAGVARLLPEKPAPAKRGALAKGKPQALGAERPKAPEVAGGKLAAYLKHAKHLGAPAGDAYLDPNTNIWSQKFEHGIVRDDGQILFDNTKYWLAWGKLDYWLKYKDQLGAPVGEAYCGPYGVWQQDFEKGQTHDEGWVRIFGSPYWIAPALTARPDLGPAVGEAYQTPEGVWTQDFERGRLDATGAVHPREHQAAPQLADGTLVQENGQAAVYVIRGGAKVHIPNEQVFARMGFNWNAIVHLEPGGLRYVPPVPPDGSLVREDNRPEVYLMRGGKRCHIPNPDVFAAMGFKPEQVLVVPDSSLGMVAQGRL